MQVATHSLSFGTRAPRLTLPETSRASEGSSARGGGRPGQFRCGFCTGRLRGRVSRMHGAVPRKVPWMHSAVPSRVLGMRGNSGDAHGRFGGVRQNVPGDFTCAHFSSGSEDAPDRCQARWQMRGSGRACAIAYFGTCHVVLADPSKCMDSLKMKTILKRKVPAAYCTRSHNKRCYQEKSLRA